MPDDADLHLYGLANEPTWWAYRCNHCGAVGLAVTEEPQCAGPRYGVHHPWSSMTPVD